MNHQHKIIKDRIAVVHRRWRNLILLKGSAQVLITALAAFGLTFALDAGLGLGNAARFVLLLLGAGITMYSVYATLILPLMNRPSPEQLARHVEERHPELEDRLVSAVELGGVDNPRVSTQILDKLLDDARFHIEPLNLPKTVRPQSTLLWSSVAAALMVMVGAYLFSHQNFSVTSFNRIFTPWKIRAVDTQPQLLVTPGHARVPRGAAQEIRAETIRFDADAVTLYFSTNDTAWNKTEMDRAEQENTFVFNLFDIQSPTRYYVKADDKISDIFNLTVYDAPQIKRVDLIYSYPDYTGLKTQHESDGGDIWAPEGTQVTITAIADKALKDGRIVVSETTLLRTTISADTVVTASFTVTHDTQYKIHITDVDGLTNDPPPEYYVHALPDLPPILTIEKPGRDIQASMIEEVPIKISVQDDYGLASLKLFYTVNGGEETTRTLPIISSVKTKQLNELREFSAEHLFYLENLNVQPGDFLTYYAKTSDVTGSPNQNPVTSEIQFIEIRPFAQEFFRPLSQGQGGPGGGGGRLSQVQKDIIVATWKVLSKKDKLNLDEFEANTKAIAESQKNLQEVTQSSLLQMEQRSLFSRDPNEKITEYFAQAIKAMREALDALEAQQLNDAITPERDAYQNLLRAEAQITEVQIQRAQASGAASSATLDELAQLFDQEMDKLKNKYETLREHQQQQTEEEMNQALEKVKELARRQQLYNQRMRDLARKELTSEEQKRQIEELRRQQEELRRETQELTRQMQGLQQNAKIPKEVQDSLRRTESEMDNSSNSLRQRNAEVAAAKGQRALNNLKRLEDLLQRNQKESLRRKFDEIDQQLQNLVEGQKELAEEVEQVAKEGNQLNEVLEQMQEDQQRLQEDWGYTQGSIKSLTEKAAESKNEAAREMRKFSQDVERAKIENKMATAGKLLQDKQLNSALQAERDLQAALERMREQFTKLRGELAESEEEKLDLALDQTRKLRENLESFERELKELHRSQAEKQTGQQQTASGQNAQAGPDESRQAPQQLDPNKIDWWNTELAKSQKDLELIQEAIQVDTSLSRQFGRIQQKFRGVVRNFAGGSPERLKLIEAQVLNPLRGFEAELAQKLELLKNKEKLFLAREEKVPAEYEELVKKYYEALSKTK